MKRVLFALFVAAVMILGFGQPVMSASEQIVLVFNIGERLDLENQAFAVVILDKGYNAKTDGLVVREMDGVYVVNRRGVLIAPPSTGSNVEYAEIMIKTSRVGDLIVSSGSDAKLEAYFGTIKNGEFAGLRKLTF